MPERDHWMIPLVELLPLNKAVLLRHWFHMNEQPNNDIPKELSNA